MSNEKTILLSQTSSRHYKVQPKCYVRQSCNVSVHETSLDRRTCLYLLIVLLEVDREGRGVYLVIFHALFAAVVLKMANHTFIFFIPEVLLHAFKYCNMWS